MDKKIYTGAVKDVHDGRDLNFGSLGYKPLSQEEWDEGFDIESVLGYKIEPFDQMSSLSCVGQAFSMYKSVLDAIEEKKFNKQSAKAIYSQIRLLSGGAYLRDGAKKLVDWGSLLETRLPSTKPDGTTDEAFMRDKSWVTDEISKEAKRLKGKHYYTITGTDIDVFARAIKEGYGCVLGVEGNNNGTWHSTYPKSPKQNDVTWGHAIFAGKFRIKNGVKEIGVLNSWGNVGENGWQWLTEEEWFKGIQTPAGLRWFMFNPWVVIDEDNNNYNINMLKIENNTLVTLIEGVGAIGLYLDGKIIIDDVAKMNSVFIARNSKDGYFSGGPTMSLTQAQWDSFDHINLKGEEISRK